MRKLREMKSFGNGLLVKCTRVVVLIVQVMQVRVKLEDFTKSEAFPGQVTRELIHVLFFYFSGGVSCIFLTDISTACKCSFS